ncbi:hypothetical protein [Pseudomonas schmalbachii]|uniref:Uncharacterized protein n=1 Tax=Pseudomonas schmalbachii TaxID=2816993 RepID=A0ABS3TRQ0_9PSED|nr:hypothetical protein [Pseudomonas schmalbachii]MBO3276333.1 hypothetical protein [Pseudomonas schmalbachii]
MLKIRIRLLIILTLIATQTTAEELHCKGVWSSTETALYRQDGTSRTIHSKDNSISIEPSQNGIAISQSNGDSSTTPITYSPPLAQTIWNNAGNGFAINSSEGGLVGTWSTEIYVKYAKGKLINLSINDVIQPYLNSFQKCDPPELANYAAIGWSADDRVVLLIIESPPHSSCRNMGEIMGVALDTSANQVIQILPQQKLKKKWREKLGQRINEDCQKK